MKHIMLDTSAYIAFKGGDKNIIEILQHADTVNLNAIVIGELLAGFAAGAKEIKNKSELNDFLNTSRCQMLTIDENTPFYYAQIYKLLRQKGRPIPANDLWIAAVTMQHGHILCTLDQHFDQIEGLFICAHIGDILL